jgi:hypothetical protein
VSRPRSLRRRRLAGLAGIAGGVGWAGLTLLTFAAGGGVSPLGYATLELLTPVALVLAAAGAAGFRVRSRRSWSRLTAVGYAALFAGLVGAVAGSAFYVALGRLTGWTFSVWAYFLALVGATVFGIRLLRDDSVAGFSHRNSFRVGAALLAGTLPVGLPASFALAFAGIVSDEAIVPVGPGALLGAGVAALGWWTWQAEGEADR